ncbi:MAG: alpha/beta fold hydrolase [Candidatus Micrarchaeota archaeon]
MKSHSSPDVFRFRGLRLVGVFTRPAGPSNKRFPAVLFLHGFPGSEKNVDIQRELMERGIAGFALHFSGAWGSEGRYRFTTLVPQALAALRFLKTRPFVDPRRVGIFGFSMGGWAAINTAARAPAVKAVVAVSPAGGPEMITPAMQSAINHLSSSLRVGSTKALGRDFVKAVRSQDPAKSAAGLKTALLLVHGEKDDIVSPAISRRIYQAAGKRKKFVLARGGAHDFLDRRDWLKRLVSSWFEKNLKN